MEGLDLNNMTFESLLNIEDTTYESSEYPELDLLEAVQECAETQILYEEELVKLNKIQTAIKVRNLTMENANNIALEDGENEVKKNIFRKILDFIIKVLKKIWSIITWPFKKIKEMIVGDHLERDFNKKFEEDLQNSKKEVSETKEKMIKN